MNKEETRKLRENALLAYNKDTITAEELGKKLLEITKVYRSVQHIPNNQEKRGRRRGRTMGKEPAYMRVARERRDEFHQLQNTGMSKNAIAEEMGISWYILTKAMEVWEEEDVIQDTEAHGIKEISNGGNDMKKEVASKTPSKVRIMEVIYVEGFRGAGTEKNPFRPVDQYWSKEGKLLAEKDVCKENNAT